MALKELYFGYVSEQFIISKNMYDYVYTFILKGATSQYFEVVFGSLKIAVNWKETSK